MTGKAAAALIGMLALGACATSQPNTFLPGERTVFDNPYVAPELAERGVGAGHGGLFYPGAGRYAFDQDGNRVELSSAELRSFRERAEQVRQQAEQSELLKEMSASQTSKTPPPVLAPPEPTAGPR